MDDFLLAWTTILILGLILDLIFMYHVLKAKLLNKEDEEAQTKEEGLNNE